MIYSPEFFDRIRCTRKKKRECVELIASIITLSERARRMGLLALEDDLENIDDPLMKRGLLLVVDGTDPEIVFDLLYTFMLASRSRGIGLLKAVITLEGVLAIQAGENPALIASRLGFFLGRDIDLWDSYWNNRLRKSPGLAGEHIPGTGLYDAPHHRASPDPVAEGLDFEILSGMDDQFICRILREIESRDLAMALKGSSGAMQQKIFVNMSGRHPGCLKRRWTTWGRSAWRMCSSASRGFFLLPQGWHRPAR